MPTRRTLPCQPLPGPVLSVPKPARHGDRPSLASSQIAAASPASLPSPLALPLLWVASDPVCLAAWATGVSWFSRGGACKSPGSSAVPALPSVPPPSPPTQLPPKPPRSTQSLPSTPPTPHSLPSLPPSPPPPPQCDRQHHRHRHVAATLLRHHHRRSQPHPQPHIHARSQDCRHRRHYSVTLSPSLSTRLLPSPPSTPSRRQHHHHYHHCPTLAVPPRSPASPPHPSQLDSGCITAWEPAP